MSCVFCKIAAGEIMVTRVYEDDKVLAFEDMRPVAPVHVLVIPKRHVATLNDLQPEDDGIAGAVVRTAARVAQDKGIAESGYRTVFNCNGDAGQTVFHLHLHVLGGRTMTWPPG